LFTSDDFVPRERYLSSAFYNEWCRRQGIDATLAANVLLDGTVSAVAAVYRPWSRGGDFDRREQAIFSALTPHLQRAVQIHVRMSQPKRERANWLKILDGLRQAVLIPPIDSLHETDGNLTGDLQQKLEADENYPQRESRLAPPSRRTHRIKRAEQIRRGQRRELSSAGGKPGRPGRSIAASDAAPRNLRVASVGRQAVVR
jgi:hypothetical protein